MRLILATIILTMLAQPVWAMSVEELITVFTKWKDTGFSYGLSYDSDGRDASQSAAYMMALRDLGAQSCVWNGVGVGLNWQASAPQLAQFLLNTAEKKPEWWDASGYGSFVMSRVANSFPLQRTTPRPDNQPSMLFLLFFCSLKMQPT